MKNLDRERLIRPIRGQPIYLSIHPAIHLSIDIPDTEFANPSWEVPSCHGHRLENAEAGTGTRARMLGFGASSAIVLPALSGLLVVWYSSSRNCMTWMSSLGFMAAFLVTGSLFVYPEAPM